MSAPDDTTHAVFDEGDLRKYRHEIPNIVDDLGLSPHAYRLYGHMKRVCGASPSGRCYQGTRTLAKHCKMSVGKISEAMEAHQVEKNQQRREHAAGGDPQKSAHSSMLRQRSV